GGTLNVLTEAGLDVKVVEEVTGFPEILDGRVKTLHPFIHGGLLANRNLTEHRTELETHHIQPIDMVVVNLYPFKQTLDQPNVTDADIIENIDIGGPTMLRAAAKNCEHVTVVVDREAYQDVLSTLTDKEDLVSMRQELGAKVFPHTAHYDALIAGFFTGNTDDKYPDTYTVTYEKVQSLRYGENPHQEAACYKDAQEMSGSLASGKQLHGKELSYNNIQDANSALEVLSEYEQHAAVAVKHMNP